MKIIFKLQGITRFTVPRTLTRAQGLCAACSAPFKSAYAVPPSSCVARATHPPQFLREKHLTHKLLSSRTLLEIIKRISWLIRDMHRKVSIIENYFSWKNKGKKTKYCQPVFLFLNVYGIYLQKNLIIKKRRLNFCFFATVPDFRKINNFYNQLRDHVQRPKRHSRWSKFIFYF